jgi:hypothetical protein
MPTYCDQPSVTTLALLEMNPDCQDLAVESAVLTGLGLLGETGRDAMIFYLAKRGISFESIPSRMADFAELLGEILGPGAELIETQVAVMIRSELNCQTTAKTMEALGILEGEGSRRGSRSIQSLPQTEVLLP